MSFEPLPSSDSDNESGDECNETYPVEWDALPEWKVAAMRRYGQRHGKLRPVDDQGGDDDDNGVEQARWAARQRVIEEDYGTDDDEWCDPYAGIHFRDVAELAASMRPAAAGNDDEAAASAIVAANESGDEASDNGDESPVRVGRRRPRDSPPQQRQKRRRQLFRCGGTTGTVVDWGEDAGQDGEHPTLQTSSDDEDDWAGCPTLHPVTPAQGSSTTRHLGDAYAAGVALYRIGKE